MNPHRPRPAIDHPNDLQRLREHLESTRQQFESHPDVVGVTLNGGLSRGYGDELSEIDLTLYLTADGYETWTSGRAAVPTGITVVDGQLYDIEIVQMDTFESEPWSDTEQWDRSYAEILYDPEGRLATAFDEHLDSPPGLDRAEGLLFDCWWHFRLTTACWIRRGDAVQAHHVLDNAIDPLVESLFAVNGEYLPHEKWLVNLSRSLDWRPDDWGTRLQSAVATGDGSMEAVFERRAAIASLWDDIDRFARDQSGDEIPVRWMQRTFYRALSHLVETERIPHETWDATYGNRLLSMEPFASVVSVEDEMVTLDTTALDALTAEDLYEWHYQVVEAVRA
ncbi:hypothetical protein [Haloferax sp. DFSO52]|uniref:hypothetical protein n=1 Tax=Haloferax sp. DFSO52 TaxID=3388505 RepID=UPI003A85C885